MTFITKSKKPIKTTDGIILQAIPMKDGTVCLAYGDTGNLLLPADSASRLAVALRLAAIEVEGRGETR